MNNNTKQLIKKILLNLKPPENITISEWADKFRRLPAESSAEPGQWNTNRTPYLKKIMDSISDNSVRKVVVMSSAQVGKSEVLLNTIGYYSDIEPSPILMLQPTVETGKNFSKERISPTFRDTPALFKLIDSNRNTISKISFPGGYIAIVGANAPSGLASRPVRILLCDEIDRYPLSAGEEGDPLTLAEKRTTTFPYTNKKVYVSTPTIDGISRIQHEFEQGTMEEWELPCPGCGVYQVITWDKIHFELHDKTRKLVKSKEISCSCEKCGEWNNEYAWKRGTGRWTEKVNNKDIKSFHLSSLVSPWKPWEDIVESFLSSKNDKEMLKVWTNTELGEVFSILGDSVNELELLNRREKYGCEIPTGVLILTAAVDVQDDRFEIEVVGWGRNYESYGIQYEKLFGDLSKDDIWNQLDRYLEKTFKFLSGSELSIAHICIDSGGHYTSKVYQFCKKPHRFKITPIKGMGGSGIGFLHKTSTNKETKVRIQILGVDDGKENLMARLKVEEKGENYCHFPKEKSRRYDLSYFQGLTAEHQVTKIINGKPKLVWELKRNARNEPLDIRNYATAALEMLMPIDYDTLEDKISKGINHAKRIK